MKRILASVLLVFAVVLGHAQGTMNIYQTNGSILQIALSSIDSVTYTVTPPPLMRIHQAGGSVLSLAVAQIDSITYSTGGAPGTAQVATLPATAVGSTTAVVAGTITADGGSSVAARGICYGTNPLPTLSGPFITAGAGLGSYQVQLSGLLPNTLYYARAYATNAQGTAYGNVVAFTTGFDPGGGVLPTVVTIEPGSVTSHSASTGGQVSSDGGNTVVARGVVWGTGPNPTLANNFTVNGAGMGSFGSTLGNLLANTSYFVRAYATNGNGTVYGGTYQITTGPPSLAGVSTDGVNGVTVNAATATGTVSHQGGVTVTERGFCWRTSPNPTLQNNQGFVTSGSGLGGFVGNLNGLTGNTTYYVRAYATNSAGTAYGSQLQFTTSPVPPTVSTTAASSILAFSANSGGNVSSTGGAAVTQRGVCWSTSPNPTTNANTTSNGSGTSSFTSSLTGLLPGTTYYVRAYATNSAGTGYGNQVQFTTTDGTPILSTTAVSAITATTASSGGSISSDGGSAITVRGVCWSTSPNPTTANNVTSNGTGTGNFTSNLTDLQPSITYYVRAYATNAVTTVYGNEAQFTTPSGIPVLSTTAASGITATTASSGGSISSDGGAAITARGVCWNTSPDPTTANTVTGDGSGTGSFTSNLTGLQPGQTYYVRAYATTIFGTGYGNQVQLLALNGIPVLTTTAVSAITATSASSGGTISSDGGSSVTARGVCWSTSPNPTIANNVTSNGNGTGNFTGGLTGLQAGTTYYVRAYATTVIGIGYGNEVQFTTLNGIPVLTTATPNDITINSANSGGTISNDGGATIIARGVCWSTSPNPTTTSSVTINGAGVGSFTSNLTGLEPGATYYVRAYATTGIGTGYGNEVQFGTLDGIPVLSTTAVTSITSFGALSGGAISSDGGSVITSRGVCWSESPNPTLANNVTINGVGIGSFASNIIGLQPNTTYYLRAYASNGVATAYGNEVQFTSLGLVDIEGNIYAVSAIGMQEWMSENLRTTTYANGDPIPNIVEGNQWLGLSTGAWAHYNNNNNYDNPYGKLYNWYSVSDSRNVCPIGWHVPTEEDWNELIEFLDADFVPAAVGVQSLGAGGNMKSSGTEFWLPPNIGATNESGFAGLPSGGNTVEDIIFSEDFANGLNGNNGFGAWAVTGPNASVWRWSTTGPVGAFSAPDQRINSPSVDNGFMMLNGDSANTDFTANPPVIVPSPIEWDTALESPVLNLSTSPHVQIVFTHRFRWCCQAAAPHALQLSLDGGATWPLSYSIHGDYNANEDNNSASVRINISDDIVGNASSVKFRFKHNPTASHYYWQIDDVRLVGLFPQVFTENYGFGGLGESGAWWSASDAGGMRAWVRTLDYMSSEVGRYYGNKRSGLSVRCLRD